MGAFEHVLVLLSFVYALALTHLLSRIAGLYMNKERVRFDGLLGLAMVITILLVFLDWLALWQFRTVTSWDLASIADEFALAVALYFACAVVAPDVTAGEIDLEAYYRRARRPFYWLFVVANVIAMLGNLDFLKSAEPAQLTLQTIIGVVGFVPPALALAVPARWAQWTAGIAILAMEVAGGWLIQGSLAG